MVSYPLIVVDGISIDIRPRLLSSAYIHAPFDVGKKELESMKLSQRIISLNENARFRFEEDLGLTICQDGNWTKEGVVYVTNKGIFLTKNSPIMENPEDDKEYFLTDDQVEKALEYSVELNTNSIPTNRFSEEEVTSYAFNEGEDTETAKNYGLLLKDLGINDIAIKLEDLKDKPFVRQVFFTGLDNWPNLESLFEGDNTKLDKYERIRGICYHKIATQSELADRMTMGYIRSLER